MTRDVNIEHWVLLLDHSVQKYHFEKVVFVVVGEHSDGVFLEHSEHPIEGAYIFLVLDDEHALEEDFIVVL